MLANFSDDNESKKHLEWKSWNANPFAFLGAPERPIPREYKRAGEARGTFNYLRYRAKDGR